MRFGIHLPSAGPGVDAAGILQAAQDAERLGFDSVWMFDHLFTPAEIESRYPYSGDGSYAMSADDPFFDPLALFGVLAGATSRVQIGTGVLIGAYRHPIVLAKVLASVERFAPRRVILGIGAGWMREEFEAVGVSFDRRGARLEEYVRALRSAWSGEPTAFDGEFYRWPKAGMLPAPTAPIPIVLGGHSDRALRRAATIGDGWAVVTRKGQGSGLDGVRSRVALLRSYLDAEDRDPGAFELLYQTPLWFSDEANPKYPLTGPPEHIAETLAEMTGVGISIVDLVVFGPPELIAETAERFAREVRPLL